MDRDFDPFELLALWWKAESQWSPVAGFPDVCPSCAGWRSSRQYDSDNGAADGDSRGMLIRHVGGVVRQIDEPYRTALYMLARNIATGAQVWRSARLPENTQARASVVSDAVEIFVSRV